MTSTRYTMAKQVVETSSFLPAPAFEGLMLDLFTASALVKVYEALGPANQAKFDTVPLPRLLDFVWKQVGK